MDVKRLQSAEDLNAYDAWVKSHPQRSLWQSLEWKKFQESVGREVRIYAVRSQESGVSASALVVIDRTVGGFSTWDIPRGPLTEMENGEWRMEKFFETILADAKKDKCISLYFSPIKATILNSQFSILNSARHEQPEATRILDLALGEAALLAQMHQKGRYNIKVAEKNGVVIQESKDIDAYYELAKKTAGRDGFGIPSKHQLKMFLEKLPGSFLLLASSAELRATSNDMSRSSKLEAESFPVAGVIGVVWNKTGIYYYGASDYEHRNLMAPYLLQWEAMKRCKAAGCTTYDLLGIAPPASSAELSAASNDTSRSSKLEALSSHPWAGISGFKEKFGGTVITYPPEQEMTLRPIIKTLLQIKRKLF